MAHKITIDDLKEQDQKLKKTRKNQPKIDANINITSENRIQRIDPNIITRWVFKDRPESELDKEGITELSRQLKEVGQINPCTVRPLKTTDNQEKYELIIGERRWRAAIEAGIFLDVKIENLSDPDAWVQQFAENENRLDISDYSKYISANEAIENGILTEKEICTKLKLSRQAKSRIFSYRRLPNDIITNIPDMSKITGTTAEALCSISKKKDEDSNEDYKKIIKYICSFLTDLSDKKIGYRKVVDQVKKYRERLITKGYKDIRDYGEKIYTTDGYHLISIKSDGEIKQTKLAKEISSHKNLNKKQFARDLIELYEKHSETLK
jgi:ParB family transcriptional regulator, chromosome partitioning protein